MTSIAVPAHVAAEMMAEEKAAKAPIGVAAAYVDAKDVVLDPTKLPANLLDRLPQPSGWRVLVMPYQGKRTSDGGIVLVDQTLERERLATVCGYVLKVGPDAYNAEKFSQPWCKEGDWIIFGRYAGARFKIEGGEVRLLNDDEILATIANPDDIVHI